VFGHSLRRVASVAGITALAAIVAAGCGSSSGGGGTSKGSNALAKDQTLNINIAGEPDSIDPAKPSDIDSVNTLNNMFASLYRIEGQDSEVVPYLATDAPKISDDGLTYTVKIRDDAKWSDGTPLTAEDVAYGVKRATDPDTASKFALFVTDYLVGACEYNAHKLPKKDQMAQCGELQTDGSADAVGVKAIDDTTVEFKLKKATPWFDQILSVQTYYPTPKQAIEKFGDKWTEPGNIVTSGPFTLKDWKHKQSIDLVKSKTFWDADKIKLDNIHMAMIGDAQTALQQFKQGKLDTGYTRRMIAPDDIDEAKTLPEYVDVKTTSTNYMYLNTQSPELKDPKVRQGIAQAVDRKSIVDNITKRGDTPLNTIIPTTMPGWDTIKEGNDDFLSSDGSPDVDKAKELLKEGGYNGEEINLYFTTEGSTGQPVATEIQSDLSKAGVKVKLVPLPSGDALYDKASSPVDPSLNMVLLGWGADYLDPYDYYQLFATPSIDKTINTSMYSNPEFDKKWEESGKTIDKDARFDVDKELEGMLTGPDGDMPAVPLYQPTDNSLVQKWVKGLEFTPSSLLFLDDAYITEH